MSNYYANLKWDGNTPSSTQFEDIYYSLGVGLEETRYVFHKHNNLENRFSQLTEHQNFIIGETGFGSGLNFIATILLWRKFAPKTARLHFISIEKYPLLPADLARILGNFPEINDIAKELTEQYYLPLPSFHRLSFNQNIELTLAIGDVYETLQQLDSKVDAWFLDGFSPQKNQEMWTTEVCYELARLSHNKTSYATFTSSGMVRNNLAAAGFNVNKVKGFAQKREMIHGTLNHNQQFQEIGSNKTIPKLQTKIWLNRLAINSTIKEVAIIGGGISGAATAYSLAKRGYQVTIFEKNPQLAMEASGNHQGMLYGSWSAFKTSAMELSYSGYRYSHYLIRKLLTKDIDYAECGLIQLYPEEWDRKRKEQLLNSMLPEDFFQYINSEQIENLIAQEFEKDHDGLYFPSGIWLKPTRLVNALTTHPLIKVVTNCEINQIKWNNSNWELYSDNHLIAKAPILVLANAYYLNKIQQTKFLPLRKIRGQVSLIPAKHSTNKIICGKGYITPVSNGYYTIGATFNFEEQHLDITAKEHQENLDNFRDILPKLLTNINMDNVKGQVNFRTSPHDYLAAVGPVAEFEKFSTLYAKVKKDRKTKFCELPPNLPNLLINVGHGAKGILTAPICGEIIADYIDNTPLACSEELRKALHPNRLYAKLLCQDNTK